MSDSRSMSGKFVLITGGARGLGRAMAEALAGEGAAVLVTSRALPPEAALPALEPGRIAETYLDVAEQRSVMRLFAALEQTVPRLDVMVNNAGIGVFKPIAELSLAEWQSMIDTNLTGAFLCARETFRWMKRSGGGRIINIGSIADHTPIAENGGYGASKFGLRGLSYVLIEEGKPFNIRVSLVCPGAVWSDIWQGREGFERADMLQPEDIAATVLDIARRPLHVRIDEVRIVPPKGVL